MLDGTIPPEIGLLSNLTTIDLSGNQLTGPLPDEVGRLTNLVRLDANGNQLTDLPPQQHTHVDLLLPAAALFALLRHSRTPPTIKNAKIHRTAPANAGTLPRLLHQHRIRRSGKPAPVRAPAPEQTRFR